MGNSFKLGRRQFMAGVGAGVGLAASSRYGFAAGGRVVIGTWGGDYARLLNKNIEQPFLIPKGYEVIQDQAGDPERRAKMAAERRLPRGSADVQATNGTNMFQVFKLGLTQELDFSKMPNAAHLLPSMKFNYGVPHIYSGKVVLYNPDIITKAPTSYADIMSPSLGDKVGIIDIQYQFVMMVAALITTGKLTDLDEGKKLLLEMRKAGARIYPTNEAFAQGLKTAEIGGGIMWKARAVQWQNAGIKVNAVTPSEGMLPYTSGFVIPKNAPNVDAAYAYINASLEPAAQQAFAVDMGYDGTIDNANIDPALKTRIGFTPEEVAKIQDIDFGFILDNDVEMKSWWDKEFKA